MGKKKTLTVGQREVSPNQGIELLTQQIEAGNELLRNLPVQKNDYDGWKTVSQTYIEKVFGINSFQSNRFNRNGSRFFYHLEEDQKQRDAILEESLRDDYSLLKSFITILKSEVNLQDKQTISPKPQTFGNKIFLVHGHDTSALNESDGFLKKLKQDVVILNEEPNQGKTIIEKFEHHAAEVGFAVVLLTPDDLGGSKAVPTDQFQPRARQNVIFELGYFIGRLGRSRVCALRCPGVEVLSDYEGVLYIELDQNGGWKLSLAKELKKAGFPVDMNDMV